MLKIEDLKVGDKLEFISDESKEHFLEYYGDNKALVLNCFTNNVGAVDKNVGCGIYLCSKDREKLGYIDIKELLYFRKVETKAQQENTTTILVNANIKSHGEMYKRLIEGEVFYHEGDVLLFDGESFVRDYVLFDGGYIDIEKIQVQKPWWEFASEDNPILCKVWDDDKDMYTHKEVIKKVDKYFEATRGSFWNHATPVEPSECFQGG